MTGGSRRLALFLADLALENSEAQPAPAWRDAVADLRVQRRRRKRKRQELWVGDLIDRVFRTIAVEIRLRVLGVSRNLEPEVGVVVIARLEQFVFGAVNTLHPFVGWRL